MEAYKTDHGDYPAAAALKNAIQAVEPTYVRVAPPHDAWGRPYLYERSGDGFRLVSAGADGKSDRKSWHETARNLAFDADAVVSDANPFWFRSWEFR